MNHENSQLLAFRLSKKVEPEPQRHLRGKFDPQQSLWVHTDSGATAWGGQISTDLYYGTVEEWVTDYYPDGSPRMDAEQGIDYETDTDHWC